MDTYSGPLLRLISSFVPSRAVAEEVLQDVWLAVVKGIGQFEGRAKLSTWIYRIAVNRAKTNGVREDRSRPMSFFGNEAEDEPAVAPERFTAGGGWSLPPKPWNEDTPERLALRAEAMAALQAGLEKLSPNQRAVVVLCDVEGVDPETACNILEVSETNFRVLQHRARSKLRQLLEDYLE